MSEVRLLHLHSSASVIMENNNGKQRLEKVYNKTVSGLKKSLNLFNPENYTSEKKEAVAAMNVLENDVTKFILNINAKALAAKDARFG